MKIIHFYPNFDNIGGAQSMVITLFKGMKAQNHDVKISGFTPYKNIHERYKSDLTEKEYIQFSFLTIAKIKKTHFFSHHRKLTTYLQLISKLGFSENKLIHIAHNEFFNLKLWTLFPKNIIAVSNRVKQNLIDEFNVHAKRIKVIYNGIESDIKHTTSLRKIKQPIKLVYPARINPVKKQLELVSHIQNTKTQNIVIHFCGNGNLLAKLKDKVGTDNRFVVKGMVDDMEKEYQNGHFTLLFTEKEGLPVSLIESCKYGLPIICNDVGGNLEIVENNYNGYVVNTYEDLLNLLEKTTTLSQEEYSRLCENSKNVFQEKFTQDKMIMEYLSFVQ
jgi:glycosyltransferase involved in cell wall biosynthesis